MLAVNKTIFKNSHRRSIRVPQDNSNQEVLVDLKLTPNSNENVYTNNFTSATTVGG
jgi:hypothetical protein